MTCKICIITELSKELSQFDLKHDQLVFIGHILVLIYTCLCATRQNQQW